MPLGDTQKQLEQVIADLRQVGEITVSTVWPIAKKVVGAVRKVISIATEPPPPEPDTVRDVAARWREMAPAMGEWHANDVQQAQNTIPDSVWGRTPGDPYGETTGDKARTSIANFKTRSTTIGPAATGVASSLDTFAGSMEKARARWHNAFASLKDDVDWNNIPKNPFDAIPYVRKLVGDVLHGVEELAGAYGDADKAVNNAKGELGKAMEGITLPDHTSVAAGAIGSVNNWSDVKNDPDGHKDGTGLRPGVQERADANLAAMSPEDRAKAQAMLDNAKDEARRNWIISALARGGDIGSLQRFSEKLAQMDDQQVRELDPVEYAKNHPGVLVQPDGTTCGSSSLVVAKMINDPMYAMKMLTRYDANGSAAPQPGQSLTTAEVTSRFADEAKKMHDSTNNAIVPGWGTTWPESLGTPPGGAADEMGKPGGPGVPGSAYQFEVANPLGPSGDYQAISAAVQSGQSVPLFVGSGVNGHIVLVTGIQGDSLEIYEPSSGQKMTIPRDDFVNNRISFGGETRYRPWGEVIPK